MTTTPGTPVVFATSDGAPSGAYTATETMPTDTSSTGPGTWRMTSAVCNGASVPVVNTPSDQPTSATASYTAVPGSDVSCLFTNSFTPSGSIDIVKTSEGGTGRFEFSVISPNANLEAVGAPAAVTTSPGQPVTASPSITGVSAAPGSRYLIRETLPAPDAGGFWQLASADCGPNSIQVDLRRAGVLVALTPSNPHATCHFVNRYQPYGTLSVVKNTTPDEELRPGEAEIDVACTDGIGGPFSIPAGRGAGDSGIAVIDRNVDCIVTESASGAAEGVAVTTTAELIVDGGPPQSYTLGESFTAELGSDTQLVITNRLQAPSPSPSPSPPPGTPPPGTPPPGADPGDPQPPGSGEGSETPGGDLAVTGSTMTAWALTVAAALLLGGSVLWGASRRSRRRARHDGSP
nr:hypothetical protein [Labedella phragmitis]